MTIPRLLLLSSLALCACLAVSAAQGADYSFVGSFQQDDDVGLFQFSIAAPATVTLRTWSFAGGTNAAGALIAPGGFSPVLSLFAATGSQDLLQLDWSGGHGPGPRAVDPISGFAWDSFMSPSLNAGDYILALTEDDNTPVGPWFADGFLRTGQGNFTGPAFLGQPGAFILADGSQRTSAWAVDILGVDWAVPEPSCVLALCCGLAGFLSLRRRRKEERV